MGLTMGFDIHWAGQQAHKVHRGHLSAQELIRSLEVLHADDRFDRVRDVIHDFSAVDGEDITADTLGELVALQYGAQYSNPDFRVAFVCRPSGLRSLLEEVLLAQGLSTCRTTVVDTLDAARQWLKGAPQAETYGRWTTARGNSDAR
jgi:hypothetical protein